MKYLFIWICAVLMTSGVLFAQEDKPVMKINKTFDYGRIDKGSTGLGRISFYNEGSAPLVISGITSTCGCTVPTWPKEPILPGDSSVIEVKYDTRRVGDINKQITVKSNASEPEIHIRIRGQVLDTPESIMPEKIINESVSPVKQGVRSF